MYKKYKVFFKTCVIILLCAISALATVPFGYRFAEVFSIQNVVVHVTVSGIFGITAGVANAILGIYSLKSMQVAWNKSFIFIGMFSFLGAVPMGFFSLFGYQNVLPLPINLVYSAIIILVNSAINHTAITNVLKGVGRLPRAFRQVRRGKISWERVLTSVLGCLIGLAVSSIAYLATTNGLTMLFVLGNMTEARAFDGAKMLAIIPWLSIAALFINANQAVSDWLYQFAVRLTSNVQKIRVRDAALLIGTLLSGSAFAQMVLDFYNPNLYIPAFFTWTGVRYFAYYFLCPLTLCSSAAVNYFALKNMIEKQFHRISRKNLKTR